MTEDANAMFFRNLALAREADGLGSPPRVPTTLNVESRVILVETVKGSRSTEATELRQTPTEGRFGCSGLATLSPCPSTARLVAEPIFDLLSGK